MNKMPYAQREVVKELLWQGHTLVGMACNEAVMSNGVRVDWMGVKWSNLKN